MARYIDIEGAGIGKANREQFLVPEFADGWNALLKILEKEPTADVVEVKHGEWKRVLWVKSEKADGGYWIVRCSQCRIPYKKKFDYCPYCGARMDGGKVE